MSLNGITNPQFPLTIDGTSSLNTTTLTVNGQPIDPSAYVPYVGAVANVDVGANEIFTTTAPSTLTSLTNRNYVDAGLTAKVSKSGDTMTGTLTVPALIDSGASVDRVAAFDGSKQLISSSTSIGQLTYLNNVSGDIQAQLNSKASTSYVDAQDANLQTQINTKASTTYVDTQDANLQTQINTKASTTYVDAQDALKVSKSGDTMTGTLTVPTLIDTGASVNTVAVFDGTKTLSSSSVSTTTLGYLDATSSVQTQLNSKASITYVDTQNALKVSKSGDTMSGTLDMGANKITTTYVPVANSDMANKLYVDNAVAGGSGSALLASNNTWTGGTNNFNGTLFQANSDSLYTIREALVYTTADFTAVSGTIVDLGGGSYRIVGGPNGGTATISGAFPYKSVLYRITISCAGSIGGCTLTLTQNGTSLYTANITTVYPTYTTITFYVRPPWGSAYDVNWVFYAPTFGGYVYFKDLTIERVKANVNVGLGALTCENAPTNTTDVANKAYVDSAVSGGSTSLLASNNTWIGTTNTFNGTISTPARIVVTGDNPGDMISKRYGSADRYGLGQYVDGITRLFTANAFASASIRLSLATDDITTGDAGFTDLLTVLHNGAVGIGTSSPSYLLHIQGSASGDGIVQQIKNTNSSGFSAIYWGTDQANVGVIFKNGSSRSADGGANTMTVRNAGGDLRLQATGGVGLTVTATTGDLFTTSNMRTSAGVIKAGGDPKGSVQLTPGTTYNSGYVDFNYTDSIRAGYIGYADTVNIYLTAENGRKFYMDGVLTNVKQPYVVLGANASGSVYFGAGYVWPGTNYLTPYYGTGLSNTSGGGNGWDTVNSRFYTPYSGRWQVNISFYWNSFPAGTRVSLLRYNSANTLVESRYCALNGGGIGADTTQNYSMVVYSNNGDWWRVQFTSGGGAYGYFAGIDHSHMSWTFLC